MPPAAAGGAPSRRRRDVRVSLLLGLVCLLVYNSNLRTIGSGDTLPARYLPFGIWRYGSVLLDPIVAATREGFDHPYWIVAGRAGHSLSLYPVVLPLLVAPLYAPAVGYLYLRGWDEPRLLRVAAVMEKLAASLLAAAASALVYLLLRRRAPPADALLLALAFAFGTDTWVIGSQALWQHGLAELLLIGVLLLLTGPCTVRRALAAGILCGLIAGNRPPDALLAGALLLYGIRWAGRRAPWLAAGAAVPLGLVLAYNLAAAGSLTGGYGIPHRGDFFRNGLLEGVAGLMLSPARGLLVFSPFLLLVPAAFWRGLRDRGARALTLAAGGAVLAQVLFYAKADWRAGYAWGPRWLTDLLPLLVWMLPPALAALRGAGRAAFMVAVGVSMAVQVVGAFWYTGVSDAAIFAAAPGRGEMRAAWDPGNTPFIVELRHRRAVPDPEFTSQGSRVSGRIDRVTAGGRHVEAEEAVTAGTPLVVEGWALADGRSPATVEITLDGQPHGVTDTFFDRYDVRDALHETSPAGWRIVLATDGLKPGAHLVAAAARAPNAVHTLPLGHWAVTVLARRAEEGATTTAALVPPSPAKVADLAAAARAAARLIGGRQRPAGFWLTSYTGAPRFAAPRYEMNTFLTAMMVDLLAPVAATAGLGENLARARAHLGDQIEASGLVRYHGRPDGPTIPSLGCAITPDADDTALAWRLTGGTGGIGTGGTGTGGTGGSRGSRRALLARALATLARYRTREGLYRTWLAPRERYECLDPGADPNPTDAIIQIHVLLFLAQSDPPAARALCAALGRALGEDRVWVYYAAAPLLPLLRQADLRPAGCPLRIPEARLSPAALPGGLREGGGQEVWLAAGRALVRLLAAAGPGSASAQASASTSAHAAASASAHAAASASGSGSSETLALLRSLASDDFALLRRSPPLLYHNDFSGHVPRFYWSEDFGYALWLRLYMENARRQGVSAALP
jgi:hypothetical protein